MASTTSMAALAECLGLKVRGNVKISKFEGKVGLQGVKPVEELIGAFQLSGGNL